MQHLLLTLSIVLLTIVAGNENQKRNHPVVMKEEKPKPKKAVIPFSSERFSVWSSRFDMIVN